MASRYSAGSFRGATGRSGAWLRSGDRSPLLWLVPFAVAALYLIVFLVQLSHNLSVIAWNSDYASDFTMPTTLVKTGAGGNTILGTAGGYVPLWFGLLTATLPLHRELWEIAPTVLFLTTALAVGWSVAQVASRRAAILAALLILAASPRLLYLVMAPIPHSTVVYPGTALGGAYLIWLARDDGHARVSRWLVPPLAGVLLGALIASDYLIIATCVVPLALTALLAGVRRTACSRRIAVSTLVTVVLAVPIAKLTSTVMGSLGYATLAPSTETASLSALPRHAELMWEGLRSLLNGYLAQTSPGLLHHGLGAACEVITVAALLTLLVVGVKETTKLVWWSVRRADAPKPSRLARSLHIIYWSGSAIATCVAFALSIRTEYVHEAYYATLVFSLAAVIVLLPHSRSSARWLVSVGASVFFAASIVGLTSHYIEHFVSPIARAPGYQRLWVPPIARYESQITAFALANHAMVGYAGYGDASNLTWISHERILVRPVSVCETSQGLGVCPFFIARVPAWYAPADRFTFLLVDSTESYLAVRPPSLGRPIASRTFGQAQVYIYPYDLAARLG
jgi:hypothetical protein